MRCLLWCLCLLTLALPACTGGADDPMLPDDTQPDGSAVVDPDTLDRDLTGNLPIDVTLNGAATTDPDYQDPPHPVTQPASAGEIALFTLKATAIPAASSVVLARFTGPSTYYGALTYPTTGATQYLPLYLTATESMGAELYNSATRTGAVHSQAVRWQGSFKTLPAEDAAEP
ncbi:MAG TPA: hypothetical protein VEI97_15795, partial [bacterium]|nr:hypothetical protein [bacterium]